MRLVLADHLNDTVGEVLPAFSCMGSSVGALDSEGGVQQQNALISPGLEATVVRNIDVQVAFQLFVDVDQRWRRRHTRLHREAQAMRLIRSVIRVLAKDDHFHVIQRRGVQRIEDQWPGRIDFLAGRVLLTQKLAQLSHVGLFEFVTQGVFPAGLKLDAVVASHGYIR